MNMQSPLPFAVALGIGLLIGVERERRKRTGLSRPAAGIRSFALASLLGAVSVHLGGPVLLGLAEVGALLLLTRAPDAGQGMATRAALLLTLALGGLCLHDRRWPPAWPSRSRSCWRRDPACTASCARC